MSKYAKAVLISLLFMFIIPNFVLGQEDKKTQAFYDNYRFGLNFFDELVCDPVDFDKNDTSIIHFELWKYAESLGVDIYSKRGFIPFPENSLSFLIGDRIGDTLTVIWHDGIFKATIAEIGYFHCLCHANWQCLLKPIDSNIQLPPDFSNILISLKEDKDESIIPYKEYEIVDDSLKQIHDSILTIFKFKPSKGDIIANNNIISKCYGPVSENLPDTCFLSYYYDSQAQPITRAALYRVFKSSSGWKSDTLIAPYLSPIGYIIDFAIDIDEDGLYEYHISNIITSGGYIYSFDGKKAKLICESDYAQFD